MGAALEPIDSLLRKKAVRSPRERERESVCVCGRERGGEGEERERESVEKVQWLTEKRSMAAAV
jgi:hypothetical protein